MVIALWVVAAIVVLAAIVLFVTGWKKGDNGKSLLIIGFSIIVAISVVLLVAHWSPTKVEQYKVVYASSEKLTIMDEDGDVKYIDLSKIAHSGYFTPDTYVEVVMDGIFETVRFVTPAKIAD